MLFDRDQLKVAWYSWQRPENVEGCLADTRNVEGCLAETGIAVWLITETGNECSCLVETRELMWEPCKAKLACRAHKLLEVACQSIEVAAGCLAETRNCCGLLD